MPAGFWEGVWYLLEHYWPLFLRGLSTTLLLAALGTLLGFVLGMGLTTLQLIPKSSHETWLQKASRPLAKGFSRLYIQIFRGTPMMVQAIIIYYGAMRLWGSWPALLAGIVVVSLNTAAYIAEIIRAGINAIDKGQHEAARSLGLTYGQTMRRIILPQAIKNVIPSIGNEFIVNVKDTSVLNVIAVTELFYNSTSISMTFYRQFEVFFITSVLYFIITLLATAFLNWVDRRLGVRSAVTLPTSATLPFPTRTEDQG
jgi:putative lysine transport system permease protein